MSETRTPPGYHRYAKEIARLLHTTDPDVDGTTWLAHVAANPQWQAVVELTAEKSLLDRGTHRPFPVEAREAVWRFAAEKVDKSRHPFAVAQ